MSGAGAIEETISKTMVEDLRAALEEFELIGADLARISAANCGGQDVLTGTESPSPIAMGEGLG